MLLIIVNDHFIRDFCLGAVSIMIQAILLINPRDPWASNLRIIDTSRCWKWREETGCFTLCPPGSIPVEPWRHHCRSHTRSTRTSWIHCYQRRGLHAHKRRHSGRPKWSQNSLHRGSHQQCSQAGVFPTSELPEWQSGGSDMRVGRVRLHGCDRIRMPADENVLT